MGAEQSYFMVPVTSGLCIEPNRSYYNQVFTKIPDSKNENQHWVLERQGNQVAFRNVAGKDYLHSLGKNNQSDVRCQNNQHWWTLEPGRTAGSFWIKSESVGGYLCNPHGAHTENNKQWMWSWKEPIWTQRLLFYLQDTKSLYGSPDAVLAAGPAGAESPEQAQAKEKEAKEKEAQIAAKEKEIADKEKQLKDLEAKEKDLAQRQKAVEAKEKDAAEKQKQLGDLNEKQKDFESKQRDFEARQKAATEKQSKLEEREKKVAAKEASVAKGGKGSKDAQSQVEQLQGQLAEANKALEDARHREAAASSSSAADSSAKDEELAQAQEQIAQLRKELREMRSKAGSAPSSGDGGTRLGQHSDPSSDNRWTANSPLAAGARRTRPPGLRTDYDSENDPRWQANAPGAEGAHRKQIPGLKTGGDYENDPRWTSNAPAAARTKQPAPEGMKTREPRPVKDGELRPIVMPREFGYLPRLRASS